mgnify:CR=1 FL=1
MCVLGDLGSTLVRVLQRNRANRMCVCNYKEIYFKELTEAIKEAGKSKTNSGPTV